MSVRGKTASTCHSKFDLFLENSQLVKAAHPILGVPCPNYFPVLEFVNVDRLDTHRPILRGKSHQTSTLRARDLRADNHLIAFLQHVLDLDAEIGERRGQLRENLPGAGRSGRLIWSRRDVDPIFAQDPIEESGIPLAECVVPEQDVLLVPARVRGVRASTDHRHSQKEKYIQAPFAPQGRPKARTAPP